MSKKIEINVPVIATRGVVVFPKQDIMIEVGRPKSMNAIEESQSFYNGHVWLVSQRDIMIDDPSEADLYTVGTLAQVKRVRRKDGFMRVTFSGVERAQLIELTEDSRMMYAKVLPLIDKQGNEMEEMALVRRITRELENIAAHNANFPSEVITQMAKGVAAPQLADQFAQFFPLPFHKKQALLEQLDVNERMLMIIADLNTERQLSNIENEINEKVRERVEESQREYYLREKMRAIKEELGDVSSTGDDVEDLRQMIENNPYPKNIKEKAREELNRYEMLPQAAGESGVIRTYLDWLLKTPWYQESQDNEDLKAVRRVLDEDHFGLEKVKGRIMEYLAVKQQTKSLKAPILCLVGPPGVGKTSLAKSIARALDRKFVKASLGGVRDEAEIRGHRRTYLGALPGRFIQGMKKAGVINPVFLIDELDKMASDFRGDPASAMLEVLDPEQNYMFSDHYLEEPYDLSKVMFIATANYLEDIPEALRDRLEIIELSSYTEQEKVEIAKRHLVAKQLDQNGLNASQFRIKDDIILYLIRHYTREAGVRQLERTIASLARKAVLELLTTNRKSMTITLNRVKDMLGREKFEYGKKETENQVGLVTGLAYTQFGGDVLPIEVTTFEGKGRLILTGRLGDVMKESAEIALGFVKSHAVDFNIDSKYMETHDIHIHVPEGAIPKDGPSAGITLTTAIVSALTDRKVESNLAMTGEVTLRGNVLPIGGLKEKSLAAHRVGIDTVIIPKRNEKDLEDVPKSVKDKIKFIPVEKIDQVLKVALEG